MGCVLCKTTTIIRAVADPLLGQKMNQKVIDRESSSKSNTSIRQSQIKEKSASNDSKEEITATRPTTANTTKSTVPIEIISRITSSQLNKLNTHDDIDASSTLTELQEVVMQRKVVKDIIVESFTSDILEDFYPNETPSKSHWSYIRFDNNASSLSSTNVEKTILPQETFVRFISTRPKHSNTHQQPSLNDVPSDSDESYPFYKSICSSTSSNSEGLSIQQEIVDQETLIDTETIQTQQKTIANEKSNKLDKTDLHFEDKSSSISSDSKKMTIHKELMVKSVSPNQIHRSTIQQKSLTLEISSDLTEVEI
ncbi:unnamed protein product [Rotaria sp. Silwood2]|nr:unnamed protein product [Rotaria sp. Silwood2]